MPLPESVENFLKSIGVLKEATSEFRYGEGFVGRHTQTTIIAIIGICFFGYLIHTEWMLFLLASGLLAVFARYSYISYKFADKHPDHALMEGGTLATWQKVQLAAKNIPNPPTDEPLIGRPENSSNSLTQSQLLIQSEPENADNSNN
jgi:hypothetical protein